MLADKYLRFNSDVRVVEGEWRPLSRSGSADNWENAWAVITESSPSELLDTINSSIAANKTYGPSIAKWTRANVETAKDALQTFWTFNDEKGAPWKGVVQVVPVEGQRNQYTLSVKIARSSSRIATGSL